MEGWKEGWMEGREEAQQRVEEWIFFLFVVVGT